MKGSKHIVILLLLPPLWNCKDVGSDPPIPLPQGTATITDSSVMFSPTSGYHYKTAFSFSKLGVLPFNWNMFDSTYDVLSWSYFDWATKKGQVGLISPGDTLYRRPFRFIASYPDAGTASEAFKGLMSVPDTGFVLFADSIQPYQIWILKTNAHGYAKILIQAVWLKMGTGVAPYDTVSSRVTFDWVFQPNGSKSFGS
jgi:hypothetical protein